MTNISLSKLYLDLLQLKMYGNIFKDTINSRFITNLLTHYIIFHFILLIIEFVTSNLLYRTNINYIYCVYNAL